ncbi:MAG: lipoyl(octanoyl) transferase LipB [Terriglobales bacterium]
MRYKIARLQDRMISVLQLGNIDYGTGLRLQEKLIGLRKDGRISDALLLLEHAPVITLGRNAKSSNVLASPELLAQRGVEVFECNRGGDVTFHGPGQLVAYPIFDLRGFPTESASRKTLGVIDYVRRLEEVIIRTCADFGIPTKRIPGLTGVWTRSDDVVEFAESSTQPDGRGCPSPHDPEIPHGSKLRNQPEAKIAALGVHISRGVTSHGVALNVNTDLNFFNLIVPCGITAKPVTSMEKELGRPVPLQDVAHSLSRNFGTVFHSQILWLDNLDALLGNNLGVPMQPPENLRKLHGDEGPIRA